MISGSVRFYNSEQGFGLIRRIDGEKDVRFHLSVLRKAGVTSLPEGQKVKFKVQTHPETGKVSASVIELE